MKQAEENSVIQGLISGDESAYRYIFSNYYEQMCIYANAILGDEYQAQAIVSDVISHIYEIRSTIAIRSNLRSYLLTSTRNACINSLGTKAKRTERNFSALKNDELGDIFSGADYTTPQGKLLDNELSKLITDYVDKMPTSTKNAFIKSKFQGMTYRQIASQEGVSANTIKCRIKNALKMLESHFGKYLDIFAIVYTSSLLQSSFYFVSIIDNAESIWKNTFMI